MRSHRLSYLYTLPSQDAHQGGLWLAVHRSRDGVINGAAGVINEGERSGAGPGAAGCSDGRSGVAGPDAPFSIQIGGSTFRRAALVCRGAD